MIVTPGPIVGQMSGRIGGIVASHNRGGAYFRNGSIPTRSTTIYAQQSKALLALVSASWAALTAPQQLAWKTWSTQNPVTNRLGRQITLAPHAAFVQINTAIILAGGVAIAIPPIVPPPAALLTLTSSVSIAGPVAISWTATPLGADECIFLNAAVSDNPGVSYVENLYKLVLVTALADASPTNYGTELAARFGTLQAGQRVFLSAVVVDSVTGLRSGPMNFDYTLTA